MEDDIQNYLSTVMFRGTPLYNIRIGDRKRALLKETVPLKPIKPGKTTISYSF